MLRVIVASVGLPLWRRKVRRRLDGQFLVSDLNCRNTGNLGCGGLTFYLSFEHMTKHRESLGGNMFRLIMTSMIFILPACNATNDRVYADARKIGSPEYLQCVEEQAAKRAQYIKERELYDSNVASAQAAYQRELVEFEAGERPLVPVRPELRFQIPMMPRLENCLR